MYDQDAPAPGTYKRKNKGGKNQLRMNAANLENQVKCLEHRLEKTKQRRNETLSGNSQLKAEIDNLR